MPNKGRGFHEAPEKAGGEGWLYSEQQQKLCHFKPDKAEMEAHAVAHGLKPVSTVTKKLECLVLGDTPGEKKVMKAEELGIKTLHAHEYLQLYGDS